MISVKPFAPLTPYKIIFQDNESWQYSSAPFQNDGKYTKLNEYLLNDLSASHMKDVFSTSVFETAWKTSRQKKKLKTKFRTLLILSGTLSVIFGIWWPATGKHWAGLCFAACLTGTAVAFTKLAPLCTGRQDDRVSRDLLASAKNPEKASKVMNRLELLRNSKASLFYKNQNGIYIEISDIIWRADNWLNFILADLRYREAIFVVGSPPIGALYILKSRPGKDDQFCFEHQYVLKEKAHAQSFVSVIDNYDGKDPALNGRELSPRRKSWYAAVKYLVENWTTWENYQDRTLSAASIKKFEEQIISFLKVPKDNPEDMTGILRKFLDGKNRNFRNWLVKLDFIES